MTVAQWPASLPQSVLIDGASKKAAKNTLRTEMDQGPAKTRLHTTANTKPFKARLLLDGLEQVAIFEAFYETTLASGSLPFEWVDHHQAATSGLSGFGSCLSFAGGKQYVQMADAAAFSFTGNIFTIEFWMKTRDRMAALGVLGKGGVGAFEYHVLKLDGQDFLTFKAFDNVTGADLIYQDFATIPDNNWHHYAWVGTGTGSKAYRDGAEVSTGSKLTGGDMNDTTQPLTIGKAINVGGGVLYMDGMLDDVRLWNVARSAGQIAAAYGAELVGDETNLIGYWRFNEGSGITAEDSTTNNRDGTILNALYYPQVLTYRFVSEPEPKSESGLIFGVDLDLEIMP